MSGMEIYYGKSVSTGIEAGKVLYFQKSKEYMQRQKAKDCGEELSKFHRAVKQVEDKLMERVKQFQEEGRKQESALVDAHRLLLTAPEFLYDCEEKIEKEQLKAECAVYEVGEQLASQFGEMEDSFMKERASDIRGVVLQLLHVLGGKKEAFPQLTEPVILVAEELTPAETLGFDKSMICAIVVNKGSTNSHSAILARLWNVPALIDVEINKEWNGQNAIVDGEKGIFYLNPTPEVKRTIEGQRKELIERKEALLAYKSLSNETRSGKKIELYANVGCLSDVEDSLENDAGGIGLFRTEFLFLGKECAPSEEEQFVIYRDAAIRMKEKPVIIRTMDIGMDKQIKYIDFPKEENPALGLRGIRASLACEELFKTQLRAIFRAAAFGDVRIMYPMVTSVEEIRRIKEIVKQVKEELKLQNYCCGDVKQGIMIETPAAAVLSDLLADEVDFFSIGTNDLAQYTLAADRQNPALFSYYEESREAVLRLIKKTVINGHAAGIPVGICGEMAADTTFTEMFLNWGVDELSLAPFKILEVRAAVRACE